MKTPKKLVCALAVILISPHAWAWGDREQGILQGLAGAWILGRMLQHPEPQPAPPPVYYTPPPVYVPHSPPPAVYYYGPTCYQVPHTDHYGRVLYYRQICR